MDFEQSIKQNSSGKKKNFNFFLSPSFFKTVLDKKDNKNYSQPDDIYYCPACNNHTDISKLKIPYAFKLFLHEMMAMCIAPRIRCTKTIYNS